METILDPIEEQFARIQNSKKKDTQKSININFKFKKL